tara:strand:- start:534 stop:674 length:141 start_codon:yes stop_codon:yes gene_type:complete
MEKDEWLYKPVFDYELSKRFEHVIIHPILIIKDTSLDNVVNQDFTD